MFKNHDLIMIIFAVVRRHDMLSHFLITLDNFLYKTERHQNCIKKKAKSE